MSTESGRQYGLILPKKGSSQEVIQRPAIFDEGSDSGGSGKEGGGDWVKKSYQREALKSVDKRQISKALTQDPTIFQYDEVYDDIKVKTAPKKEEKKQSRYIQSLKRHAERRKLENERRLERQVQKERQAEGEEFKDKETFVTSSYKKKLEEFQKMEEEEKRMDRLEEIGDVSKQKDISGFYRHLYRTTVDIKPEEEKKDLGTGIEKVEVIDSKESKSPSREPTKDSVKQEDDSKQKRQYRKRTKSVSSKEEGEKTSSSSSSSSYSSSSSSDSEDDSHKGKKRENKKLSRERSPHIKKASLSQEKGTGEVSSKSIIEEDGKEIKKKKVDNFPESDKQKNDRTKVDSISDTKIIQEPVAQVNIWLKRTVGTNFDEALLRYLERKSKRQGSC